jgi:hypothetical protein
LWVAILLTMWENMGQSGRYILILTKFSDNMG